MWWLGDHVPSLGEVRGRIVLLRRFALDPTISEPLGIDVTRWADNRTFEIQIDSGIGHCAHQRLVSDVPAAEAQCLIVQDLYNPPPPVVSAKLDAVCSMLETAKSDPSSDHFYINYLSASPPLWNALHWFVSYFCFAQRRPLIMAC